MTCLNLHLKIPGKSRTNIVINPLNPKTGACEHLKIHIHTYIHTYIGEPNSHGKMERAICSGYYTIFYFYLHNSHTKDMCAI